MNNCVKKFADHDDLFGILKRRAGCRQLQKDYTALRYGMVKWKMGFNANKCDVHMEKQK